MCFCNIKFAKFLVSVGIPLERATPFCLGEHQDGCATWSPFQAPSCGQRLAGDTVLVAVKTCKNFHKDRVPVVKSTWAKDAERVIFYSDVDEPSIPTVTLGVDNVERGHCAKTMAILKHALPQLTGQRKWLVISDDDTLLSIPRLLDLLSCFDPDKDTALGERYGFGLASGQGYGYLTGGSGMVFSKGTVRRLVQSQCSCPSKDSPDDMLLGACLQHLGIPLTHSPLFHQARPDDYSPKLLSNQRPISFHKFWMLDPIKTYRRWLIDEDASQHDEL